MMSFRCTRKLLALLKVPVPNEPPPATTILGDWYCNVFYLRPTHFILLVSEKSRLPVLVPRRQLSNIESFFLREVAGFLDRIGIAHKAIDQEIHSMNQVAFGAIHNKSLLGSMNDFAYHLRFQVESNPNAVYQEIYEALAEIPCGSMNYQTPIEATRKLFPVNRQFKLMKPKAT
jgi:hypothetical protein